MTRKFYNVPQFVQYVGEGTISKPNVYKLIQKGKIPVIYVGKRPLIPASWVKSFCKNGLEV